MSRYRRSTTPGATWFFTVVTFNRRPILCDPPLRLALGAAVREVKARHPFGADAWLLLPDHLHCIWTLPAGDAAFGMRWSLIKRLVSRTRGAEYPLAQAMTASKTSRREATIWQRRFWEHQIRDPNDYRRHMDYVHYNPVRHGLCARPGDWPWSSFHRLVRTGFYPPDWATGDADLSSAGEP